ncbi:MAG: nicotinate-nucleotide--dimethylbenzimidazole phosphoribosyltransferase [Pararhodobacter sp.]
MTATDTLARQIQHVIDTKTKPLGALGRIEALAAQIAALQHSLAPRMESCTLTIFAADHGIARAGVSAFPQEVTAQMVLNFLNGGAAANVFARMQEIGLQVVDAGVAGTPIDHPDLIARRIGAGTASFLDGPAMSPAQAEAALAQGAAVAREAAGDALAFGEMGIGNTAAAAALSHKLSGLPLAVLVGRGTGLDDAGLERKLDILTRACARTGALDARAAMAEYGGFEIVMMAGAMLAAAQARRLVLVDGFIATAAALLALALDPAIRPALVFAHRSHEAGHRALLDHLDARPLLELDMRLGEGTGALLAWPLLRAAARMMTEMASFDEAGVSNRDSNPA